MAIIFIHICLLMDTESMNEWTKYNTQTRILGVVVVMSLPYTNYIDVGKKSRVVKENVRLNMI